ncbi:MAG TPA: cytidylate kinase-like family protein [Geobacteraceae bacterium]
MAQGVVLTISRQLGSGGAYLGRRLARRLGVRYLDREILRQAARELHEMEGDLAAREERLTGFWEKFFREMYISVPEAGYVPPALPVASDEELFAVESDIIRKAAAAGGAVIVGRCAFHVLRGVPAVVNVFLHADEEFRCRRLMELYGIGDADVALRMLADSDRQRRRFVEAMTGVDWMDVRNYHLSIDTGFAGLAAAEELLFRLAETRRGGGSAVPVSRSAAQKQ